MGKLSLLTHLGIVVSFMVATNATVRAEVGTKVLEREKVNGIARETIPSKAVITEIPHLKDLTIPSSSASSLLAQQQLQINEVTGIKVEKNNNGLDLILETANSDKLQPTSRSEGNVFIVEIPNAQLKLTSENTFRQEKPATGIAEIEVVNSSENSIKIAIKGEASLPKVELDDSDIGLIFVVTPVANSAQQPPDKPSNTPEEPIELTVTGDRDRYRVENAPTSTKIDVPLRDIPQSIQVVPQEVLQDRKVTRLDEFTDNVSGVQRVFGFGTASGYNIRGFFVGYEGLKNGFRSDPTSQNVANVERVEILKGPSSVLYGGGTSFGLSGIVNTVTKKPLETPFYAADFTVGNNDFYRGSVDLNGSLLEDKSGLYRLNLAYDKGNSYRDFVNSENFLVAPAITLKPGPNTTLTAEFEYLKYSYIFDKGLPLNPISLQLPVNRFIGESNLDPTTGSIATITSNFEHKFSEDWKFRQGLHLSINNTDVGNARIYSISLQDDGRTLNRTSSTGAQKTENYTLQSELTGKFKTGSLRHNLLLGLELARYRYGYDVFEAPLDPIDIFNPVYGSRPGASSLSFAGEQGGDNLGIYLQNLVEFSPNFKVAIGGRFDVVDSFFKDRPSNTVVAEQTDSNFSPRVGLVYQPMPATSIYFNWSRSFVPQFFSRSRNNEQFQPEKGEQFEVGIKHDLFDNRLSATLALFQITRQNVLTPDPVDTNFSIQTGEQRSRGIELDIAGEVVPGWKIIATYAYTDVGVTEDNSIPIGDKPAGVPKHSASLWTTYELQKGNLQGLGLGLGLVYSGEREVSLPNTFTVPSYLRTDASLFYRRNNYRVGLNFKNIFNTKYYEVDGFSLLPAAPFTVLGTASIDF